MVFGDLLPLVAIVTKYQRILQERLELAIETGADNSSVLSGKTLVRIGLAYLVREEKSSPPQVFTETFLFGVCELEYRVVALF